jgi:hypothetical protein
MLVMPTSSAVFKMHGAGDRCESFPDPLALPRRFRKRHSNDFRRW